MDDDAVRDALRGACAGEPTPAAVAAVDVLEVRHARRLDGLMACRSLRVLILVGCDPVDWEPLRALTALRTFRADHCPLDDLDVLSGARVHRIRVLGGRLRDLGPLRRQPELQDLDVRGNPLTGDPKAPQLAGAAGPVDVLGDAADVREVNVALAAARVPAAVYTDGGQTWLAPVGLAWSGQPEAGHAPVEPAEVLAALGEPDGVRRLLSDRAPHPSRASATPGLDLLERLAGRPRAELLHHPGALGGALRDAGRVLAGLAADLASPDPEVRAAAEARRAAVLAEISAAPPPEAALRTRLSALLDDAVRAVRNEGGPPDDPDQAKG